MAASMDERIGDLYDTRERLCKCCRRAVVSDLFFVVCDQCIHLYPPSLLKAVNDDFDYALRLKTGEIIRFSSAEICGDYVVLKGQYYGDSKMVTGKGVDFTFDRGIDVRLDSIVWCADAPNGT